MSPQVTLPWVMALVPEILLLILLFVTIGASSLIEDKRRIGVITAWGAFAILLIVIGLAVLYEPFRTPLGYPGGERLWGGMLVHGPIAIAFRVMFLIALILTSLISVDTPNLQKVEYSALLITSTMGFSLMAMSADFIMLFVALETSSISLYLLAGFISKGQKSPEAGMKYFVYGAFASAVMLYGFSMIYGLVRTTNLFDIATAVNGGLQFYSQGNYAPAFTELSTVNTWLIVSAVLIVVGFGFKISAVPFHFWAPDVYEGAPTPVTAFVSTASKAAGFAVLLRVFNAGVLGPTGRESSWWALLVAMCVMTMTVGNLLAIYQTNIKRLLAYSSVGQAGYVMIALVAFDSTASGAAIFYLLMYVFTNIAAFGVIVVVSNITQSDELSDFNGLSRRAPYLAIAMLIALLSLGGIPPTAGFFGKFFIFKAAVEQGLWWLALIGILNAFVSLYYYLSVVKYLYLYRSDDEEITIPLSRATTIAIALSSFGVIYLGIFANQAFEWSQQAAQSFFP